MRKIIAGMNMTLDGFCDHTAVTPDEQIHRHYADLLRNSGTIIFGRTTYQLMEFWKPMVVNPSGNKAMDEFAAVINDIPKLVFSNTLTSTNWDSASIAKGKLQEEVQALKQQNGNDILIGSRSIMIQLMKLNLIDEFQFCVHPVIAGSGSPLFQNMADRKLLKLLKTKKFESGALLLYYEPIELNKP
jgi:dihydrofolate reductase